MVPYILMILGFVVLVKSADIMVEGASSIGRHYHISNLTIGLTIVAFGTSTPELFVNLIAGFKGNTDIAIGNVIGSNIANILLILGISSLIYPLSVSKGTVWREIPFAFLAAILLGILANDQLLDQVDYSVISRSDGLVFLSFFLIFMYYSTSMSSRIQGMESVVPTVQHSMKKAWLLVITGFIGLSLGGKWIVDGAVHAAVRFGMSESVIGLTIVAVGTSLPELATSAVAAYRRNVEIAVGNVVGSNIFNTFFVLGSTSMINIIPFNPDENLNIIVMIAANLLLFLSMFTGKKRIVDRWEGAVFLTLYVSYMVFIIRT